LKFLKKKVRYGKHIFDNDAKKYDLRILETMNGRYISIGPKKTISVDLYSIFLCN